MIAECPKCTTRFEVSARFTPPTVEEVRKHCADRRNGVDPVRFWSFYESKGWMIGKNRMKSWKAAIATWERMSDVLALAPKPEPIKRCFNCPTPAVEGALVCHKCAWCVDCDTAGRESRKPALAIVKSPKHGYPACKDCASK